MNKKATGFEQGDGGLGGGSRSGGRTGGGGERGGAAVVEQVASPRFGVQPVGRHRQHRAGRQAGAAESDPAQARRMGVSRAVHRMPRRRRRRQRRGMGACRRVRARAQAATQAPGLHRGRFQASFHPERFLPHRCGSVQVDLARPRGRARHAGVQVPSRTGSLGGDRLHQDAVPALGGGGGLAGGSHHHRGAAASRRRDAARGQGRLRPHAVRRVPRPPRQGRRTVGAGSRGRQRPADRAPGLHRRRAVRGRQRTQGCLPDVHHRAGRNADALVRGLPRRSAAMAARLVRDLAPARIRPVCRARQPAGGARGGYRAGCADARCRPGCGAGPGGRSGGHGRRRGDDADHFRSGIRGRFRGAAAGGRRRTSRRSRCS